MQMISRGCFKKEANQLHNQQPQPAQQMAPPPPRPPATPFNMEIQECQGSNDNATNLFNQGPGFFTPQQSRPKIALQAL